MNSNKEIDRSINNRAIYSNQQEKISLEIKPRVRRRKEELTGSVHCCKYCGMKYYSNPALYTHVRNMHKMPPSKKKDFVTLSTEIAKASSLFRQL